MSRTSGRRIFVRGRWTTICWSVATLERHYAQHPGGERDPRERLCWADLLENDPPIPMGAYEEASYDAVQNAEVHCTIREDPEENAYDRFVDGRLVTCLAPDDGTSPVLRLRTCFHHHFRGRYNHVVGEHRSEPPEQRLLRYSEWLTTMADMNEWDIRFHKGGY